MPDIDAIQMLLDIEAIKQLKARYFRYVDTKQWDDLKALFTADARWSVDGGSGHYEWDAPEEFIAHVSRSLGGAAVSVHQGHMPEIELIDAVSARGIWAMFDYVDIPGRPSRQGYGHYREIYRKESHGWRIASMELTRLRVDALDARPQRLY